MASASLHAGQMGLPEFVPDLIGLAGTLVLVLVLVALGGMMYRSVTGGIEWPDDEEDDDTVRRSDPDDEWDYY